MAIYNDFLNREEDVENILNIVKSTIESRKPMTIALEGQWGIGKSWILEKLEAKLKGLNISNKIDLNKYSSEYFVFKYNAWENDYFNEPLVAILTSFCSQINNTNIKELEFKSFTKKYIQRHIKKLIKFLEYSTSNISKKTLGFDVVEKGKSLVNIVREFKDSNNVNVEIDDQAIGISRDIENVVLVLNEISKIKPIVFIVDELDRCIPEFAIKTLERFHHVFGRVQNSLVIVSIDEGQLTRTIQNMYGEKTPVQQYLKKFFKFYINVNVGFFDTKQFLIKMEQLAIDYNINNSEEKELLSLLTGQIFQLYTAREKINLLDKLAVFHSLNDVNNKNFNSYVLLGEMTLLAIKDCRDSQKIKISNINPFVGNSPENNLEIFLKKDLFKIKTGQYYNESRCIFDKNDYKQVIFYIVNKYFGFISTKAYITDDKTREYLDVLDNHLNDFYKYCRYIKY